MRSRLLTGLTATITILAAACGSSTSSDTGASGSPSSGASGQPSRSDAGSGATGVSGSSEAGTGSTGQAGGTGSTGSTGQTGGTGSTGSTGQTGGTGSTGGTGTSTGGASGSGGTTDGGTSGSSADDGSAACTATSVVSYPSLPGAVSSPLYKVSANGSTQFVEKLTKFTPEMEVHYTHFAVPDGCTASVSVTVSNTFNSFTLSPKSRNIAATKSGNTITFTSAPNYLILQIDSQELLFILIDTVEASPPQPTDANVHDIMDDSVDNTGATLMTTKIQSAIDAASGATKNILYFPPGKYQIGEIWPKSNMTIYLAAGAVLYGSSKTGDYNTGSGGLTVESDSHGLIHFLNVTNSKILGRGVIDGNGVALRTSVGQGDAGATGATGAALVNTLKIDASSNILIDGIVSRDSSFWNTLIYKSDKVTIQNYKVINQRPTTTTFNQTDGVDFDSSTNGLLSNAFLYTGDDNMATKTELNADNDTNGIVHQHVVTYSNSGACKVGTKTGGTTMDGIVWKDIDVVRAGRALVVDGDDTAVVQNTIWQDIRVETTGTLIDINEDRPPTWRPAANTTVTKNSTFQNVTSAVDREVNIHGKSATVNVDGVHIIGMTVAGKAITAPTASWSTQDLVNLTFQ